MEIEKFTEITNNFIYERMGEFFIEKIPLYTTIYTPDPYDAIGGYFFLNNFALELCKELKAKVKSDFITQSIHFINEVSKSTNLEIQNLIKVGVLEILYSDVEVREDVRKMLEKESLVLFLHFEEFYL
jgi:hypothetical protein